MRFEEVYSEWSESRLSQEEAALIPGVPGGQLGQLGTEPLFFSASYRAAGFQSSGDSQAIIGMNIATSGKPYPSLAPQAQKAATLRRRLP